MLDRYLKNQSNTKEKEKLDEFFEENSNSIEASKSIENVSKLEDKIFNYIQFNEAKKVDVNQIDLFAGSGTEYDSSPGIASNLVTNLATQSQLQSKPENQSATQSATQVKPKTLPPSEVFRKQQGSDPYPVNHFNNGFVPNFGLIGDRLRKAYTGSSEKTTNEVVPFVLDSNGKIYSDGKDVHHEQIVFKNNIKCRRKSLIKINIFTFISTTIRCKRTRGKVNITSCTTCVFYTNSTSVSTTICGLIV